jgi:2'-5' RNA ligase
MGEVRLFYALFPVSERSHVAVFHRPGNASAKTCLRESIETAEVRLGCRPRRRTALLGQRIATAEAKIAQKTRWVQAQRAVIRRQMERQVRLGDQLRALQPQLAALTAQYADKTVRPHSKLAQVREQKAIWERQLQSALAQEAQARRVCQQHQQRLAQVTAERDELVRWLAQLEADNANNANPVQIRWLLDGCFGDADSVTYLIEMGYDLYTIANGQTTKALRTEVPDDAQWTPVGVRTQALDMTRQQMGSCPYAVRLTLLRWKEKDSFQYSTLISFSETEVLPTAELFPTYHQRQDVEAGIKQGKSTFSFTKLRVRSPAGIRLLGQFALFFWPNFVHWAATWLADRMDQGTRLLQQVRTQVRVAANTPAVVLTNASGQMVEFSACGPYPGLCIRLDHPFVYQLPMPLFKAGQQQWPVSSESVKEQLAAMLAKQTLQSHIDLWAAQPADQLPEKVPKNQVFDRLPV